MTVVTKEGNVSFNDTLNTFYLWLYGVGHMVNDHSGSERGNPLPPHGLLFPISREGSFINTAYNSNCIIFRNRHYFKTLTFCLNYDWHLLVMQYFKTLTFCLNYDWHLLVMQYFKTLTFCLNYDWHLLVMQYFKTLTFCLNYDWHLLVMQKGKVSDNTHQGLAILWAYRHQRFGYIMGIQTPDVWLYMDIQKSEAWLYMDIQKSQAWLYMDIQTPEAWLYYGHKDTRGLAIYGHTNTRGLAIYGHTEIRGLAMYGHTETRCLAIYGHTEMRGLAMYGQTETRLGYIWAERNEAWLYMGRQKQGFANMGRQKRGLAIYGQREMREVYIWILHSTDVWAYRNERLGYIMGIQKLDLKLWEMGQITESKLMLILVVNERQTQN